MRRDDEVTESVLSQPGEWRVSAETEDGRALATHDFAIASDARAPVAPMRIQAL